MWGSGFFLLIIAASIVVCWRTRSLLIAGVLMILAAPISWSGHALLLIPLILDEETQLGVGAFAAGLVLVGGVWLTDHAFRVVGSGAYTLRTIALLLIVVLGWLRQLVTTGGRRIAGIV